MTDSDDADPIPTYRLDVSDTAEMESDAIYLWIGERDHDRALRWYQELRQIYQGLLTFPYRNIALPGHPDVRRTLHGSYRILYRIIKPQGDENVGTVRILLIIHGARQSEI